MLIFVDQTYGRAAYIYATRISINSKRLKIHPCVLHIILYTGSGLIVYASWSYNEGICLYKPSSALFRSISSASQPTNEHSSIIMECSHMLSWQSVTKMTSDIKDFQSSAWGWGKKVPDGKIESVFWSLIPRVSIFYFLSDWSLYLMKDCCPVISLWWYCQTALPFRQTLHPTNCEQKCLTCFASVWGGTVAQQ